jgi:acyl carrier protein
MQSVQQRVMEVIALQLRLEPSAITPAHRFVADLSCDSLDGIEIVMGIEDEWGIEISDGDAEKCLTVQQAIDYVVKRTGAAA